MTRENKVRLPPVPCSNVVTIQGSIYWNKTKKKINQSTGKKIHQWEYQSRWVIDKQGSLCQGSQMLLDECQPLGWWDMEVCLYTPIPPKEDFT